MTEDLTDEQKDKVEEIITEPVADDLKEESKSNDLIDKANAAAARLEAGNAELGRLLAKQEAMQVEKTLGGKAEVTGTKKPEETPEEYAKKVMANEV